MELYFKRDEKAITLTKEKYGRFCYAIAYKILGSSEDASECENDTYLNAWSSIPPHKPNPLSSFLAMITRRLSIDRVRKKTAQKRHNNEYVLSLYELEECIPDQQTINDKIETEELAKVISDFLKKLPEKECNIFLRRYWYFDSVKEICDLFGYKESSVKMSLLRTRVKLLEVLQKEGIFV